MYDLNNYFGFGDNEIGLSMWEEPSVVNESVLAPEFQANKPFRLALYVRPSVHKRFHKSAASNTVKNVHIVSTATESRNKKKDNLTISKPAGKHPTRTSTRLNTKVNVMLFDENVKPESVSKELKKVTENLSQEKLVAKELFSARKNVLKEVNTKPVTKTKQYKTRKSYERKLKEREETENIPEPSSQDIIKELEFKKLSRTKQKKMTKEEQEFEKWANSVNSDFNDVDKFELSIAYD